MKNKLNMIFVVIKISGWAFLWLKFHQKSVNSESLSTKSTFYHLIVRYLCVNLTVSVINERDRLCL